MTAFISHNKANKEHARLLAISLVEQGENVWFDEWSIKPGESLTGGIEEGLANADIFVLIWSKEAASSNWVGTEVRAYIRRRVDNSSLRIVPVMVDNTKLPVLVSDYRGFLLDTATSLEEIAAQICGKPADMETVKRLNQRLDDLTYDSEARNDPLPFIRCPKCGSEDLNRKMATDYKRDENYYIIDCRHCGWSDWTQ